MLLADLKRACNDAGRFALDYLAGALSIEAENSYASRLIDIGERLMAHAKSRQSLILEAGPGPQLIDPSDDVVVNPDFPTPLPGPAPG